MDFKVGPTFLVFKESDAKSRQLAEKGCLEPKPSHTTPSTKSLDSTCGSTADDLKMSTMVKIDMPEMEMEPEILKPEGAFNLRDEF